ncbi:MAG: CocE/NonD family hydrolase [Paracoccaceae bacterium]
MKNELRSITETPDMEIVLSDGIRLSCRAWIPDDANDDPVPMLLEYLPYRKRDGTCARDALTHPWFAKRGYACLRVDIRGNGDSQGIMEDEYSEQELADAVEIIEWAAKQPWCNGRVGMMGISWGGFNALQVAGLAPEPLKAVVTLCSTDDRYADDIHYKGGCLLNENLGWGATMWSYSSRAPDPALRPDDWRDMWLERLDAEPFLPSVWLKHQSRDAYWQHGSVCEDFSAIKAKVLAVGGWGDAYKNAVPRLVSNIPGAKGIIGPWVHKYPHFAVPEPRIGFLQEALRWWDRWLKDIETGVEADPDYSVYLMDGVRPATWYTERQGQWISANPDAPPTKEFGLSLGALGTSKPFSQIIASPQDTGADAGEYCAIWLGPEMPGDQRNDDAKSVVFDSDILSEDLDIVGTPNVQLTLSSSDPQAQIAVRLCHVHPDGASTRITYGVLNLSHRFGHENPTSMPKDTPQDISVSLDNIAYRVPAGHRIRLSISNAYWPLVWPSPTMGTLTLTQGTLGLPVPSDTSEQARTFLSPDAEAPWETLELRPENHIRQTQIDHVTGHIALHIEDDFGKIGDLDHGLITASIARESWCIDPLNPLSATGECHWTDELERDGIALRTEAHCSMTSDATYFRLKATVVAYENGIKVFSKEVSDEIRRDHL